MIYRSEEINYRTDFALLFNARGYKEGVEIGVDLGVFACDLLNRWKGDKLYLVDPYESFYEMPWKRTADLYTAVAALIHAGHHGRFRFILDTSEKASVQIATQDWISQPDFVYIDGNHTYDEVMKDLGLWWPLIPDHGMLCGHDFDRTHEGVIDAVTEFFVQQKCHIYVVSGERPESWYVYKTQPEITFNRYFIEGEGPNKHFKK